MSETYLDYEPDRPEPPARLTVVGVIGRLLLGTLIGGAVGPLVGWVLRAVFHFSG